MQHNINLSVPRQGDRNELLAKVAKRAERAQLLVCTNHIVEDGLRMLYKGEFNVSAPVEIETVGVSAVDLGGVRQQYYTTFL